jgi:hypothetical protein
MKSIKVFLIVAISVIYSRSSFAAEMESYIPKSGVEKFVAENLDLATIRSSFGPRRTKGQRTFKDYGMSPPVIKEGIIQFDEVDWFYEIEIKGRRDYNVDGIEDLALCFTDRAKGGTYSSKQSLLVTRYSSNGFLIALKYDISDVYKCSRSGELN